MLTVTNPRPARIDAGLNGLAIQLARVAHFRSLDLPEADELDGLAFWLLGNVGPAIDRAALWEQLRDPAVHLWHLIAADWRETDLDEVPEGDWLRHDFPTEQAEIDHRYCVTRERLEHDLEHAVFLARVCAAERSRGRRLPAFPDGYAPMAVTA